MNNLALPLVGEIAAFSPRTTKVQQAKLDAMITLAGKIHDWPLLERAIDAKIAEQAQFVAWYDSSVPRGRPEKEKVTEFCHDFGRRCGSSDGHRQEAGFAMARPRRRYSPVPRTAGARGIPQGRTCAI